MFLSQLALPGGVRAVACRTGDAARLVPGAGTVRDLAPAALAAGGGLAAETAARGTGEAVDLPQALDRGRLPVPIDHPDPAHMHLTGTGPTHPGPAAARDVMHQATDAEAVTDSTATLSSAAGFATRPGDVFEIACPAPRLPLRNPLPRDQGAPDPVAVACL